MRNLAETAVSWGLAALSWVLISAGTFLVFIDKDVLRALIIYSVGVVMLFFNEYLAYDVWKRKSMSGEDAGGGAISSLLYHVVTGFVLPLALAGAFYRYIAQDGRVIIVLFMGYLAALVKLGFRAYRILKARNREES